MSLPSHKLVLVVGAGPTGLTMALALTQSSVKVRIIEATTAEHDAARSTAITPRTQELLAILGAAKDVAALATGPLPMAVYGADGKTVVKTFEWSEAAQPSPTIPFTNIASIGQSQVERILRRHLRAYAVEVEPGKQLVGISQDDRFVTAKILLVGTSIETEVKCDYLMAADGAKGRSRQFVGVSFLGETKATERMWAANVEVPGFSRDLGPKLPADIPRDLAGTQELFNMIANRDDLTFADIRWITEWKANIRMADKFSVGRVYLVGGEKFCLRPKCRSLSLSRGGQGMNTAMQDAFNLAWKISLVVNGKASSHLLQSYEAERMPVVAEMLNLSTELHAKAFPHIPDSAFTLPALNPSSESDPMLRSSKLLQLGINYRWSTIIFDERDTGEKSVQKNPYGDRAPYIGKLHGPGAQTVDLFSLLHDTPSHLLLYFQASAENLLGELDNLIDAEILHIAIISTALAQTWETRKGISYFADPHDLAAKAYDVPTNKDMYVVVRPDGVIGAYTFSTKGIQAYFSLLGVPREV
ncbi:hypothetical protein B0H13DRAFT_2258022 [Mycena leptocephala]|nr:hypothetical protein B0H13DRAFT_2258022 [Mycena leptocephala]